MGGDIHVATRAAAAAVAGGTEAAAARAKLRKAEATRDSGRSEGLSS